MNIIIMGPPAAGKGTQAEMISVAYPIPHISTGDMFREAVANQTAIGMETKQYIDAGQLVPDQVTIGMVAERLEMPDCELGFLLDGFPRTTVQARALDELLAKLGRKVELVVNILVPDEVLLARVVGRVSCIKCKNVYNAQSNPTKVTGICDRCGSELVLRSDDIEETAKNRLQVYIDQAEPLLQYYKDQGILVSLDGDRKTLTIFAEIVRELNKLK
jgi:adenylate kinase